ncbi:MAG: hypothetical protein ABR533_00230, partial [Desulfonatronovibrio sp.]
MTCCGKPGRSGSNNGYLTSVVWRRSVAKKGKIHFTDKIKEGINFSDIIFLCVGTPEEDTGKADLSQVEECSI